MIVILAIPQWSQHKIPLTDETPIKEKVRQILHGMFEEVKKQIEVMLKTGVIKPLHSSGTSPKEGFNMEALYRFKITDSYKDS